MTRWYDRYTSTSSSTDIGVFYHNRYTNNYDYIIKERRYEESKEPPKMGLRLDMKFEKPIFREMKVEKPEPPQTVFHFDPKEIVDKWPEENDN